MEPTRPTPYSLQMHLLIMWPQTVDRTSVSLSSVWVGGLDSSRPHRPSHGRPNSPVTFLNRPSVLSGEEAATAAHPGARLGGRADP